VRKFTGPRRIDRNGLQERTFKVGLGGADDSAPLAAAGRVPPGGVGAVGK